MGGGTLKTTRGIPTPVLVLSITLAYGLLGAAGLLLAISPGYASPVFPAAGLALACVLWFGGRGLPGVWLGSAILNVSHAWVTGMLNPVTGILAGVIACGATIQAWAGSRIVQGRQGLAWNRLDSEEDTAAFLFFGGALAGLVSASVSVSALFFAGVIEGSELLYTWWNWYVGDTLGVLVFAPLTLCLLNREDGLWRERRRHILWPMLLTLCLVVSVSYGAARWEKQEQENRLQEDAEAIAKRINDRLITHREVLSSLGHFVQATPDFTFKQFELFTRITLQDHPDVFALSYNDLVTDPERPAFERRMSEVSPLGPYRITERDGRKGLVPAAPRPEYVAVRYIVPLKENHPAVGYDIHSEPIRRDAIERARASKNMAVTAPIRLVQERQERIGLLELLPLGDVSAGNVADSLARVVGFVVAVIKVDEMIDIALGGRRPAGLMFQLTDTLVPADESMLYRFDAGSAEKIPMARSVPWETELQMGDRVWKLSVWATKGYQRQHRPWMAWAVGVAGLLFTALLQVLMLGMTGRTDVIQRKNEALKAGEDRYQRLFNDSPLPMWLYDAESLRFLMVNDRAVAHYGWTREAFFGMTVSDLLPPEDREAFAGGLACTAGPEGAGECRHVRQDGSVIEVIVSFSPARYGDLAARLEVVQDVTQEKKNRAQLLLAEKVFENSGEAVVMMDAAGRILLTNPAFSILTGYSAEEARDRDARFLLKSDAESSATYEELLRGLSAQRHWQGEIRLRRKTGELYVLWQTVTAVRSAEGEVTHYVATASDITQRKAAEEALRDVNAFLERKVEARTAELAAAQQRAEQALVRVEKSEAMFRAMVEQAPLGVALIDSFTGRIDEVNERFAAIVGRTREEVTSTDWFQFTHPEDLPKQRENMARLNAGEITGYQMNKRYVRPDGSPTWISLTVAPVTVDTGENPRHLAMIEDITERKDAEERLRCITDSAYDAILMMDPGGTITYWNPAAEQILGYRAEEALGKDLHELLAPQRYVGDYLAAFPEFRRTGRGNAVGKTLDLFARRKDGREVPVAVSLAGVLLKGAWHAVGILRDITSQRELEENLRRAKQAADAASAAKSEFLANMSHEIRTPMNGVLGMVGLLLDTELDEEQRRYAETIRDSGESLLGLLNDILDLSKIEAGKLELAIQDFDLRALLDDFAVLPALHAHEKGIEFICAVAPDLPTDLRGDPNRLRQVLTNLAGNAVKFTDRGEIVVQAELLSQTDTEVTIRFSIRDTGIGIPPDKRRSLFQKFTQADASTTRRYGGTGLGLAISKELAERMGGEIGVNSTEGVGSEFWFTVRLGKGPEREHPLPPLADLRGVHVLIVDDNATNRAVLAAQLSARGVWIEEAADGKAALKALRRARDSGVPFRAAILDMQMPGMDGASLGRAVKADETLEDTLLMLLTSLGQRDDAEEMAKVGFAACLTKPARHSELIESLSAMVAGTPVTQSARRLGPRPSFTDLRRSPMRVLVVEDNLVNRKLALTILAKMGLGAEAASSGAEALEALGSSLYDLVLMDVQMPEMDGLEATRQIRSRDSTILDPGVPIIAMTAHAMSGDRERCLEAGMNDYITKPVSPRELYDVLDRWLPRDPEAPEDTTPPEPAKEALGDGTEPEPPVYDREGTLRRLLDDEELVGLVVKTFLEDTPVQIEALRGALEKGDGPVAERLAHTIKGASANVGGERLRRVAFEMEKAAGDGRLSEARDRMAELEIEFDRLKEALMQKP